MTFMADLLLFTVIENSELWKVIESLQRGLVVSFEMQKLRDNVLQKDSAQRVISVCSVNKIDKQLSFVLSSYDSKETNQNFYLHFVDVETDDQETKWLTPKIIHSNKLIKTTVVV